MEFEFDKEIDAILRKARTGETALSVNSAFIVQDSGSLHLDADALSAFAENALPVKMKQLYTEHLADCQRCRKMLSNLILLNPEAETEAASSGVSVLKNLVETPLPWYRKLFVFPQLTYIMGAFVLVFGGFLAYLVVQNSNKNAETSSVISSVKERPQNMSGASSDGDTTISESSRANSNAAVMQSNTSSNSAASVSNAPMMSNSGAMSSNNSAANNSAAPRKETAERRKEESAALPTPTNDENRNAGGSAIPPPPPPPSARQAQPIVTAQNKLGEVQTEDKAKAAEISREKKSDADSNLSDDETGERRASKNPSAPKPVAKSVVNGENKRAGGKNFTRRNGVWYDANYQNQSTTNVSRGSDDYRKLDAGLRSIADGLSGTVVVVWKDKAYRIQ